MFIQRISRSLRPTTAKAHRDARVFSTQEAKPNHTTDSYSKDVDSSPPPDSSIHRVDPDSESVQKPHEPPSGEWSRAGTQTRDYENVDKKDQPYAPPGSDVKRYGDVERKTNTTSKPDEGPEGSARGGVKG